VEILFAAWQKDWNEKPDPCSGARHKPIMSDELTKAKSLQLFNCRLFY